MIYRIVCFLIFNFCALALGSMFTKEGVPSSWYVDLVKAPWTPPGWVFGAFWTIIMICFSIYMASAWKVVENKKSLIILYLLQWILNVSWNPAFFYYHHVLLAIFIITALTGLIAYFLFFYWTRLQLKSLLISPYLIWLLIALSLNVYIYIYN